MRTLSVTGHKNLAHRLGALLVLIISSFAMATMLIGALAPCF